MLTRWSQSCISAPPRLGRCPHKANGLQSHTAALPPGPDLPALHPTTCLLIPMFQPLQTFYNSLNTSWYFMLPSQLCPSYSLYLECFSPIFPPRKLPQPLRLGLVISSSRKYLLTAGESDSTPLGSLIALCSPLTLPLPGCILIAGFLVSVLYKAGSMSDSSLYPSVKLTNRNLN